jgi:hypothetical protein
MVDPSKKTPSFQLLKEGDTPFFESGEDLLGAPHGGYLPDPEKISILDTKPIPPKRDYLRPLAAILAVIVLLAGVRVIWYYSTYRVTLGTSPMERNGQTGSVVVPAAPADPNEDNTLYYAGPDVTLPVLISKYEPTSDKPGTVLMVATIDTKGVPVDAKIWHPMDAEHNLLAMKAIARWRFRPATQNGKPVPVTAQLELHFQPQTAAR